MHVNQIGFLVLSYLCEAMGEQLRPFYKGMFPMLQSALEDTRSVQVPLNAIQYVLFESLSGSCPM